MVTSIPKHMSKHSDTITDKKRLAEIQAELILNDSRPIILEAKQKPFELTEKHIENWVERLEHHYSEKEKSLFKPETDSPSILLGHFGLKSAAEVIQFLHTPAGETLLERIGERLVDEIAEEEELEFEEREEALQETRLMAFLLMLLSKKHAVIAAELNFQIQEQIEHLLKNRHQDQALPTTELAAEKISYDQLEMTTQQELEKKQQFLKEEQQHLKKIENEGELINHRHELLDHEMSKLDEQLIEYSEQDLETQLLDLQNKIDNQSEVVAQQISQAAVKDDLKAGKMLNKLYVAQIQKMYLQEFLAVKKAEVSLYQANGSSTMDYDKAAFVVSNKKRVYEENGKLYLVDNHIDSKEKFSVLPSAQKMKAHQLFEKGKNDYIPVKWAIKNQQALEKNAYQELLFSRQKNCFNAEKEVASSRGQLHMVQAARANLQTLTQDQQTNSNAPKPQISVSSSHKSSASKGAAIAYATAVFTQSLLMMQKKPTTNQIRALQRFGRHYQFDPVSMTITPGQPINPNTLANMIKRFKSFASVGAQFIEKMTPEPQNDLSMR